MGFLKTNKASVMTSTSLINDFMFKCRNRTHSKHFCREGKIGFKNMILFMLNMLNQSLQVELNRFFENILKKDSSISKQAFSEARQKITPEAFIELNDAIMDVIYVKNSEYKLWNGFRVLAVDGSVLEIPDTELLREIYGCANGRTGAVARATSSSVFDVINKIVIKSKIDRYKTCEREMAISMLSEIPKSEPFNDLVLFDRGYPSAELMAFLIDRGNYFVMRAKAKYSNMVINAKKKIK